MFHICLATYGSLLSFGVMDGVRKSSRIVLYGYSSGSLVVSPLTVPSSLVKCPKMVSFLLSSSSCVNLMLFVFHSVSDGRSGVVSSLFLSLLVSHLPCLLGRQLVGAVFNGRLFHDVIFLLIHLCLFC